MAKEIERKFLVKGEAWKALAGGTRYRQGYLNSVKERTVRVRTIDDKGYLTVKGITTGATRSVAAGRPTTPRRHRLSESTHPVIPACFRRESISQSTQWPVVTLDAR